MNPLSCCGQAHRHLPSFCLSFSVLVLSISGISLTSCTHLAAKKPYACCMEQVHLENLNDLREVPVGESSFEGYGISRTMPASLDRLRAELTWPMAWRNAGYSSFDRWRDDARSILFSCMGKQPAPAEHFQPTVIAREERDGYTAMKVLINLESHCRVPVYLLVPHGDGPFPALLALHDHGAHFSIGKEKMVRPLACDASRPSDAKNATTIEEDAAKWSVACYDSVFTGDFFARNGYVVLAADALFWGERGRKEGSDYDAQQALASNLFQLGTNWCGWILFDDIQSAAFLASLPFVDASRIASYGHSMGCFRSWMLCAATDLVKASVNVCWMNTTEYLMTPTNNQNKGGSAYSMLLPEIRCYLDYPDVASIACPKPMLFMNGRRDKLFPVAGVESAYQILHDVYLSQNADDNLETVIYEEPHFFSREMQFAALDFLRRHL